MFSWILFIRLASRCNIFFLAQAVELIFVVSSPVSIYHAKLLRWRYISGSGECPHKKRETVHPCGKQSRQFSDFFLRKFHRILEIPVFGHFSLFHAIFTENVVHLWLENTTIVG